MNRIERACIRISSKICLFVSLTNTRGSGDFRHFGREKAKRSSRMVKFNDGRGRRGAGGKAVSGAIT